MKKELYKTIVILKGLAIVFLLFTSSFAQEEIKNLQLSVPINFQISDGKPQQFKVQLLANQTARIEVEHNGLDIIVSAFDPKNEKYLDLESPTGNVGTKVLLAVAETDGEYRIEVKPYHPIPRTVDFKIEIKEIRETRPRDLLINDAYNKMYKLSRGENLARKAKIAERRDSIRRHTEIIELSKIVNDKYWEGQALHLIGFDYYSIGEYESAFEFWLKANEVYKNLNNRFFEGRAVNNLGVLFKEIGEYERAVNYFKEAEDLQKESTNRFDKAALLSNLGSAYFSLGQTEKAFDYTNQALELYSAMKLSSGQTTETAALGQIYVSSGEYQKGIEYFQKSLQYAQDSGHLRQISHTKLQLGNVYLYLGKTDEAFEMFSDANSIARELGIRHFTVSSLYGLAQVERDRGNLSKAIEHLAAGLELIEKTRDEFKNKAQRTSYFSTVQNFYELYTDLLIERSAKEKNNKDIALAFEMSERSRARSLIDLLEEARVDFGGSVDAGLLEQQQDLSDQLNAKYQTREGLLIRKSEQEKIVKINTEINNLEIEFETLNLQIQKKNPRYSNLIRGKTISTNEIQNLLDDETVLLEYKLGEKRSFLWLVTKNSIKFYELPRRLEIEAEARLFYEMTAKNYKDEQDDIYQTSRHLNEILLSKVQDEVKGKRLVIVADGILQYLPFSSLQGADSYLADKNEIVVLPSASVLAQLRANPNRTTQNKKTIAIFADPVFDIQDSRLAKNSKDKPGQGNTALTKTLRDFRFGETLPRLLASRTEARNISNLVNKNEVSIRTDFDANLENIETSNLKDYRILHFATHGLLNSNRPELSGLVFSLYNKDGKKQNGFLNLNDIYNLDLSSDLIVLSACQTALGKDVRGEGLIGMSRGFLYAGSNRVVASLWKVDDSATAEFMKRFYINHLQKGMSASAALRQTKIEMKQIKRYQSPYYWSAFTLLGDWK